MIAIIYEIEGTQFHYVCNIIPLCIDGSPKEFMPQSRYENKRNLPLNKHGNGSFCKFKIPNEYKKRGVYSILVNDYPKYIGECENLSKRFNAGHGNISPKNCYKGGQSTNCKVNKLILNTYKKGSKIELFFYETSNRFEIEETLIRKMKPLWNGRG